MFGIFKRRRQAKELERQRERDRIIAATANQTAADITAGFNEFNEHLMKSVNKTHGDLLNVKQSLEKFEARTDTNATNAAILSEGLASLAQAVSALDIRLRRVEQAIAVNNIKFSDGSKLN